MVVHTGVGAAREAWLIGRVHRDRASTAIGGRANVVLQLGQSCWEAKGV